MHAWRPDGAHLRGIAFELRDLASRCQFPRARLELRDLAVQFERRADHLDDVTEQRSVLPGVRWTQFDLADEEASALRKLLTDAVEFADGRSDDDDAGASGCDTTNVDYLPTCDRCGGAALSRFIAEPGPYCHTVLQCVTDG